MKKMMAGLAFGVAIVVGGGMAAAFTCPLLIKQLRADLPKVKDKAKHDEAKKLTDECEKLHKAGKHAESVAKCEEAATVAGIKLEKKG
jgi:hypothetical protein